MSILIKGMDMPNGCGDCPLSYMDVDDFRDSTPIDRCTILDKLVWNDFEERDVDCPLVEVNDNAEPLPQWRGCMDECLPYYDGKEVKE